MGPSLDPFTTALVVTSLTGALAWFLVHIYGDLRRLEQDRSDHGEAIAVLKSQTEALREGQRAIEQGLARIEVRIENLSRDIIAGRA